MSNNTLGNGDGSMDKLKQYGGNIAMAIAVALLGFTAWQYWQKNHSHADLTASDMYTQIQQNQQDIDISLQNPDLSDADYDYLSEQQEQVDLQIKQLVDEHSNSIYAWQVLVSQAKNQADNANYKEAIESLSKALTVNDIDAGLKAITELRLGQAYSADNQLDAAIQAVSTDMPESFEASRQELLGDIYVKQNKLDEAKRSYENAWEMLRKREENRAILSLKMESLGMQFEPIVPPQIVENQSLASTHLQSAVTDAPLEIHDLQTDDMNTEQVTVIEPNQADSSQ